MAIPLVGVGFVSFSHTKIPCPLEQGQASWPEAPAQVEGHLAITVRLQLSHKVRDLALFNLAIDSKLCACNLVKLRASDVCHGGKIASKAMVMQQETGRPVGFEITQMTRDSILAWIKHTDLDPSDYIFPGRVYESPHRSARQYARIVHRWVEAAGLDSGS